MEQIIKRTKTENNIIDPNRRYFLILIGSVTIFKIVFAGLIDISPDEAYYWNWSRHLALSYYDHPPMVAYLIYLSTFFNFFTHAVFVRLSAVLMGTGTSYIVYLLARDIYKEERAGFWAALWLNAALLFSLGASIITPDTPQAFFCVLFLFFFYRFIFYSEKSSSYIAGFFLGVALLSKYTSFLFIPSIFLFLFISKEHRRFLKDKNLYITFLISSLCFTPVIFWNYSNGWISFGFQLSHGFRSGNYNSVKGILELLGTQALLLTPFLFIALLVTGLESLYRGVLLKDSRILYLFCTSVPILLFFLCVSARSKIEGNWPSLGYITLIVALGGLSARFNDFYRSAVLIKSWKILKSTALITAFSITLLVHLLALAPPQFILNKTSLGDRLTGWKELGDGIKKRVENEVVDGHEIFILTNQHQMMSEIIYYTESRYETYQIGGKHRYPYLKDLTHLLSQNALYVTEEANSEIETVTKYFTQVQELKPLSILSKGEWVRTFKVYKCFGYKGELINN